MEQTIEEREEYLQNLMSFVGDIYSTEEESSIVMQRHTVPEEFEHYSSYVAWCKIQAIK